MHWLVDIAEAMAGFWLLLNLAGITAVSVGLTAKYVRAAQERRSQETAPGEAAYDGA